MKKHISLFIGSFIILFMFATPGNSAKAETTINTPEVQSVLESLNSQPTALTTNSDGSCACQDVTPILGVERNKMVAAFISNDVFKNVKMQAIHDGYHWLGANAIEIVKMNVEPFYTFTGVPFSKNGQVYMYVFINGYFVGVSPM